MHITKTILFFMNETLNNKYRELFNRFQKENVFFIILDEVNRKLLNFLILFVRLDLFVRILIILL